MNNLTLYCNSHNGKKPLHTQCNQIILMNGSYFLPEEVKKHCIEQNYILDDTDTNLSHLNHYLGDLTGLYWIWKNTDHEFVGTNQYRRFYDDDELKNIDLNENNLYVSEFLKFDVDVWSQYINSHGAIGLKILTKAAKLKKIAITENMINEFYKINLLSTCNSFFSHRSLFDKTCEILFEMIFELYNGMKYALDFVQLGIHTGRSFNEKRLLAFLAERMLTVMYYNSDYFYNKNINIVPIKYKLINE